MKKYIKPTMKAINIDVKESILQSSLEDTLQIKRSDENITDATQIGSKWHNSLWDDDEEDE